MARESGEIDEMFESATREAVAAFGRGECFVERYLDRPRHVETQCLADQHGTVVVVSTRDCSLQRRHQKLVEEAPAPFLTDAQNKQLVESSKAILREAGYVGAGTCEFLVAADGTISFLEVNTRLQVEHPVTEEISGIDLVREQLRIAAGEPLGYDHVETRGHSIEFRINGEDPAAGFLPAPGRITTLRFPSGPGVRVDSGVVEGDSVSGAVRLDDRQARRHRRRPPAGPRPRPPRARRARGRRHPDGRPVPPRGAGRRGVRARRPGAAVHGAHPLDRDRVRGDGRGPRAPPRRRRRRTTSPRRWSASSSRSAASASRSSCPRRSRWAAARAVPVAAPAARARAARCAAPPAPTAGSNGTTLASPMQGTIVKVAVAEGAQVAEGDLVVVLEAMKMEQPLVAHRAGTVTALTAGVGSSVSAGTAICEIVG